MAYIVLSLSDAKNICRASLGDRGCSGAIVTILEEVTPQLQRRIAAPAIAGQGRTLGDLVSPIVDEQDWEWLKHLMGYSHCIQS